MSGTFGDDDVQKSLIKWDQEVGGSFASVIRAYLRRAYGLDPSKIETESENQILYQYGFSGLGVSVVNLLYIDEGRAYVCIEAALGRCRNASDLNRLALFVLQTNRDLRLPFRYCLDSQGTLYLQGRFSADELTEGYFRTLLESFCEALQTLMGELNEQVPFVPFYGDVNTGGDAA